MWTDPSSHLQGSVQSCSATCLEPCPLHPVQCSNPTLVTAPGTTQQLVFPKSQLPVVLVACNLFYMDPQHISLPLLPGTYPSGSGHWLRHGWLFWFATFLL